MLDPNAFFTSKAIDDRQIQQRVRMTRAILMDARNHQRSAIIWLIASIIQVMVFAFALMLPSVQEAISVDPLWLLPLLVFVIEAGINIACFALVYGQNQRIIDRAHGH